MNAQILADLAFILPRTALCLSLAFLVVHILKSKPRQKNENQRENNLRF